MENKFKQYAVISSNWVPNNPIRAFLPFIYDYILTKTPSLKKLEDISADIDELYGLHLTYSLLRSILEYLKNNDLSIFDYIYVDEFQDFREENYKILEEIMEETPAISKDYLVYLETLADSSINIKVHAYIKTKQHPTFVKERQKFWLAVIKRFRAENIEFAFPSRTIYMAKENNEN